MSTSTRHFILFRDFPLMYARIPKVANTSIKTALSELLIEKPKEGLRTTSDRFWRENTNGETKLLTTHEAFHLNKTHFSFSFVRNPFDRLVSAYNNKIIELERVPTTMKIMGMTCGITFEKFIDILCESKSCPMDNHLCPQSEILLFSNRIVPKFIGRFEHIRRHWRLLHKRMKKEGLPLLRKLPQKNIRRQSKKDIKEYFNNNRSIDQVLEFYWQDFKNFYKDYPIEQLLDGEVIKHIAPIQLSESQVITSSFANSGYHGEV